MPKFFTKIIRLSHCLILLILLSHPDASAQANSIEVSINNERIELLFNGTKRLTGGIPIIENQSLPHLYTKEKSNFSFGTAARNATVNIRSSKYTNVISLYLSTSGLLPVKGNEFRGIFFSMPREFTKGITFHRYKPWNAWTKPVKITDVGKLEPWDNQCFYWQYDDGTFGLAIPLSGNGFRSTLGSETGLFGNKSVAFIDGYKAETIPAMVIAFGDDLYELLQQGYSTALTAMGVSENLISKKTFPEPFQYLGWCTWNASSMGAQLNEQTIISGVESFTKNKFPLGWLLIDDGWFDHRESMLRSFKPDATKFPNGFKPLIANLKNNLHIQHVGIWHALNGYWNGIDTASTLGHQYKNDLFSWTQKRHIEKDSSVSVTYHFIKPNTAALKSFYMDWHRYLSSEGFTFIKVDNQLVVERMSVNNYPIWDLAKSMHDAVNNGAKEHFDNALINCMDMTNDAFYNFGSTAVARSVEDYFPYDQKETYDLQHGNAAAHILQGVYNNLYFSQMVFPDLDMFQSHNPNGEFHAIARAINNGPIYITDVPGQQNFKILRKLVLNDGTLLRADQPLLPTEDCLFQLQDQKPFKAFSTCNGIGLLGVWNCADSDEVSGKISPLDIHKIEGEKFAVYESFSSELHVLNREDTISVKLKRMGYALYYVAPLTSGIAPLGLLNKYNAPAAIVDQEISASTIRVSLKEGGKFGIVLPTKPKEVLVNGKRHSGYTYNNGICVINIPNVDAKTQLVIVNL
jgi:raffinose synthase